MKVLIDADGCPVVKLTLKLAKEAGLESQVICDSSHHFNLPDVKVITVMKGADAVDFELVKHVEAGDVIVTQDYGLAAMVLAKGGKALNQNGLIYHQENMDQLLMFRHQSAKLRKAGIRTKGPKKRRSEDDEAFKISFQLLIQ